MHTRAWRAHKPCPRSITETVLRAFLPLSLFFFPFFSFHVRRLLRGLRFTSLVCTCTQLIALSRLLSVYHCSNIFSPGRSCGTFLCRAGKTETIFWNRELKLRTWRFHLAYSRIRKVVQRGSRARGLSLPRYLTGQDKYLPRDFHDSWYSVHSVEFDKRWVYRVRGYTRSGYGGKNRAHSARSLSPPRAFTRHCSSRFFRPGQKSAAAFSLCTLRANLDSARDHRLHTVSKRFGNPALTSPLIHACITPFPISYILSCNPFAPRLSSIEALFRLVNTSYREFGSNKADDRGWKVKAKRCFLFPNCTATVASLSLFAHRPSPIINNPFWTSSRNGCISDPRLISRSSNRMNHRCT